MFWKKFPEHESVTPAPVLENVAQANEITETEFTGCAWCGTGDGEGICPACSEQMIAQSDARRRSRSAA